MLIKMLMTECVHAHRKYFFIMPEALHLPTTLSPRLALNKILVVCFCTVLLACLLDCLLSHQMTIFPIKRQFHPSPSGIDILKAITSWAKAWKVIIYLHSIQMLSVAKGPKCKKALTLREHSFCEGHTKHNYGRKGEYVPFWVTEISTAVEFQGNNIWRVFNTLRKEEIAGAGLNLNHGGLTSYR